MGPFPTSSKQLYEYLSFGIVTHSLTSILTPDHHRPASVDFSHEPGRLSNYISPGDNHWPTRKYALHSYKELGIACHYFSTLRVSMHGQCHINFGPCLIEFSGVVLSCFTLSRSAVFTELFHAVSISYFH